MQKISGNKIGLFPGTFDPIHLGHIGIARAASDKLALDTVIFIPNNIPPHKEQRNPASSEDRLRMIEIAIQNEKGFHASDFELESGGVNYTIDTLRHFSRLYPERGLWLIIGGDSLAELHTWKQIDEYPNYVKVISVSRSGENSLAASGLPVDIVSHIVILSGVDLPQSSTSIKMIISEGGGVSGHLDAGVGEYISRNELYR